MIGADGGQAVYWEGFFERVTILPFEKSASDAAVAITKSLKEKNKLIEIPDIFIAATALSRNIKIATLNKKHFERLTGLAIVNI